MGEVAGGVAELAVGHYQMDFGFVLDGVDDVGGAEGDVEIRDVVLMKQCGFVRRHAHTKNADVFIFEDEMVVGFLGDGDSGGGLGASTKTECEDGE